MMIRQSSSACSSNTYITMIKNYFKFLQNKEREKNNSEQLDDVKYCCKACHLRCSRESWLRLWPGL